jgi:hypothetical protein
MDREYFCLVTIEVPVQGGVKKEVREVELDVDPDRTDARSLFYLACDEVKRTLRRRGEADPDEVTIVGFDFWLSALPR